MSTLDTAGAVVDTLGGQGRAALVLGENPSTVGMWKVRGKIPPEYFLTVTRALETIGHSVAPDVFGMRSVAQGERATAEGTLP